MAVYVDNARNPYGRMKMSHLLADSVQELHRFAARIGLKREWFQGKDIPHYDLNKNKREHALEAGAVAASKYDIADLIRKYREKQKSRKKP